LQIAGRFYQTPPASHHCERNYETAGPFAPWELPQFIATLNPSDTFSPSFLFPVQPVMTDEIDASKVMWEFFAQHPCGPK
jgi:hypothetical protein